MSDSFRSTLAPLAQAFRALNPRARQFAPAIEPVVEPVHASGPPSLGPALGIADLRAAEERGRRLAEAEAERTFAERREVLERMIGDLEDARRAWIDHARGEVAEIVVAALEVIAGHPTTADRALAGKIALVTERLVAARDVEIKVPADQIELATGLLADRPGWVVTAVDGMARGSVDVSLGAARLSSSIERALAAIKVEVHTWAAEGT